MAKGRNPLSTVGHVFAAVAPTIGQVVASSNPVAGALVGTATSILASKLSKGDVTVAPNADAVTAALSVPAPDLEAVKQADQDFQEKMGQLGVDLTTLDDEDIEDARSHRGRSLFPQILTITLLTITTLLLGLLIFHAVPQDSVQLVHDAFMQFLAFTGMAIAYWVGSSSGSADKTEILAQQASNGKAGGK